MSTPRRRWPAEWEPHAATWVGWPHHRPDWPGKFEPIPWVYAEIVRVLHRHEPVHILCHGEEVREQAAAALRAHSVDLDRCHLHLVPTDRVWLRDSGPTGVYGPDGFEWICWTFNAWAKYDNYDRDARVARRVAELSGHPAVIADRPDGTAPGGDGPGGAGNGGAGSAGGDPARPGDVGAVPDRGLVLEGGGIETDGAGTMLVTEEWLLSDVQVRNPGMTREDYERAFAEYLGIRRTLWLGEGCVGGDTHGHIDDIARVTDRNTVVLTVEPDPADENHRRMQDNLRRLQLAAESHPGGLRIVEIPFPRPVIMEGERLPASYANFYIANGVVIVPTFNDANDRVALNTLAELFPDREVVGIHAVDLVWGLGTLHCLTQ
ncbi:MAG TPA: agmatine deiminase family protein, partial [Longimicrobiales bacterium]|nr:agmatine deiminase family protein [Longimicrobiales bacterium]